MHSMKLIMAALSACVLMACGGGGGGDASTAMAWQGAQLLESGVVDSNNVQVSINADGVGHVLWHQRTGAQSPINFASAYRGGVWQPEQRISDVGAPVFITPPQVVALPDGEALAVWQQTLSDGSNDVRAAFSRTVGGVWQKPAFIPNGVGDEARDLKMVADGQGNAIVVWMGNAATSNTKIRGAIFRNGTFGPAQDISSATAEVRDFESPDVAIDAEGNALVVWVQHSTVAGVDTIFSRANVGGVWKGIFELNPSATKDSTVPRVAVGLNGAASVVWQEDNHAKLNGRHAINFLEEKWALTFLGLGASGGAGQVGVSQVLLDHSGTTTVVWSHTTAGPQGQVATLRSARGKGSDPFAFDKVEVLESAEFQSPRTAIDASGRVMAVWTHTEAGGARTHVLANVLDPVTGKWGSPQQIHDSTGNAFSSDLSLSMNARGQALAAWRTQPDVVAGDIVVNVFK